MGTCPTSRRRLRARHGAGCAGIAPTSPKVAVGGAERGPARLGTHAQRCVVCAQRSTWALAHKVGGPCPLCPKHRFAVLGDPCAALIGTGRAEPKPEPGTRARSQEDQRARRRSQSDDMGRGRIAHAGAGPATSLIAVHDCRRSTSRPGLGPALDCGVRSSPARALPFRPQGVPAAGRQVARQGVAVARRACRSAARPCRGAGPRSGFGGVPAVREKCIKRYAKMFFTLHAENIFPACRRYVSRTPARRISSARDNRFHAGR